MAERQKEIDAPEDETGVAPFDPDVGEENGSGEPATLTRRERRLARKEEKARAKEEKAKEKQEKKKPKQEKKKPKQEKKEEKKPKEEKPKQKKKPAAKAKAKPKAKKKAEADAPAKAAAQLPDYRRIGHKGADSIVSGNTIESFEAAVESGVDMIEFDVLRTRDARLVVAHDYGDLAGRRPLGLIEVLDAFREPPLDEVEIDCDLKLPGREAELAGALAGAGLIERAMVSTMEVESIEKLRGIDPDLKLGWTLPKTRRDWTKERWARSVMGVGLAVLRRRLPGVIAEGAPRLEIDAVWVYHQLVTEETVEAAVDAGIELYAWTVDDPARIAELAELGVHGIVSNDPRLLV